MFPGSVITFYCLLPKIHLLLFLKYQASQLNYFSFPSWLWLYKFSPMKHECKSSLDNTQTCAWKKLGQSLPTALAVNGPERSFLENHVSNVQEPQLLLKWILWADPTYPPYTLTKREINVSLFKNHSVWSRPKILGQLSSPSNTSYALRFSNASSNWICDYANALL